MKSKKQLQSFAPRTKNPSHVTILTLVATLPCVVLRFSRDVNLITASMAYKHHWTLLDTARKIGITDCGLACPSPDTAPVLQCLFARLHQQHKHGRQTTADVSCHLPRRRNSRPSSSLFLFSASLRKAENETRPKFCHHHVHYAYQ